MLRRVERALAHDLVDQEAELRLNLRDLDRRRALFDAVELDELVGVGDGVFAAFGGYISHGGGSG